jgi:DNA polymerase-3 subunit chi
MTNISFYILKGDDEYDRQVFACRLASKAFQQGKQIYIHAANALQAEQLNQLLWSFRPDSFIPHQLVEENNDSPVLIGYDTKPPRLMDLLINLSSEQPIFFSQFDRVAECINDDEVIKSAGRTRYQFYQQRGYELSSHRL